MVTAPAAEPAVSSQASARTRGRMVDPEVRVARPGFGLDRDRTTPPFIPGGAPIFPTERALRRPPRRRAATAASCQNRTGAPRGKTPTLFDQLAGALLKGQRHVPRPIKLPRTRARRYLR